jgi:hypothetical protein
MPQSTGRDLHIDRLLSQMAISYAENSTIAGTIAPVVTVDKQGDMYSVFSRADAYRTEDDKRSPGTEANKITRSLSSDTYYAQNYALKYPITIEDRENADPVYRQNLWTDAAQYVTDKLMLSWEVRVAALVNNTSNVGSSAGVASEWDAAASSDPIGDLNTALDNVQDLTGQRPNRLVFGGNAWRSMRRNTDVLDRVFGSTAAGPQGFARRDQVAALMEVDAIHIGDAYRNTANEAQAESLSRVWTDNVLACYTPDAPSRDRPSYMYSYRWATGGLPNMQAERHPYDPKTKTEEVEVGYYQDEKITGAEYGFLLLAVNSST